MGVSENREVLRGTEWDMKGLNRARTGIERGGEQLRPTERDIDQLSERWRVRQGTKGTKGRVQHRKGVGAFRKNGKGRWEMSEGMVEVGRNNEFRLLELTMVEMWNLRASRVTWVSAFSNSLTIGSRSEFTRLLICSAEVSARRRSAYLSSGDNTLYNKKQNPVGDVSSFRLYVAE